MQIRKKCVRGDFQECFEAIGIPMNMWTFICQYVSDLEKEVIFNHDFFGKVFTVCCVCKKARITVKATLKVNKNASLTHHGQGLDLFKETELEVLEIQRNPLCYFQAAQKNLPLPSLIQSKSTPVSVSVQT